MAKLRELKTLMLCIFFVAVASLIALFYYAVNFARYTKIGRAYVDLLHNNTQWNRHLQGRPFSGSKEQRWNSELTHHSSAGSVGRNQDQREQNIQKKKRSNINLANLVTTKQRNYTRGWCPGTSSALSNSRVFLFFVYIIMYPCLGIWKNSVVIFFCILYMRFIYESNINAINSIALS